MATKRARRTKRRPWSKEDVRELRAHSRSKSPVKNIVRAMKRTAGALRQKARNLGLPLGHRRRVRANLSGAEIKRAATQGIRRDGCALNPQMASTVR
jgi:hypothetical protein